MEWNVRRLWGGPEDGGDAQACVEQHIEAAAPDVLVLLEIDRNHLDRLQAHLDLSCTHIDYRGTGQPHLGGLAICTRGEQWMLTQARNYAMVDGDSWQYLFAEIEGSGSRFNVLAAHLHPYHFSIQTLKEGVGALARGRAGALVDLNRTGRQVVAAQGQQTQALLRRVQRFRDPTLLVGDFNSVRDASLHVSLRRLLVDTWEVGGRGFGSTLDFSSWIPLRVDYIYATEQFAVTDAEVLDVGCSDHRPVISSLNLSGQDLVSPHTHD